MGWEYHRLRVQLYAAQPQGGAWLGVAFGAALALGGQPWIGAVAGLSLAVAMGLTQAVLREPRTLVVDAQRVRVEHAGVVLWQAPTSRSRLRLYGRRLLLCGPEGQRWLGVPRPVAADVALAARVVERHRGRPRPAIPPLPVPRTLARLRRASPDRRRRHKVSPPPHQGAGTCRAGSGP